MADYPFTPLVRELPATVPFVGPETQERSRGRRFRARIGANESVFGPSPKAIEAMRAAAPGVWMYADPENHDLKQALAAHHDVRPENVTVGGGIDGLLGDTVRMFVEPGVAVVTSALLAIAMAVPLGAIGWVLVEILDLVPLQFLYASGIQFAFGAALVAAGGLLGAPPPREKVVDRTFRLELLARERPRLREMRWYQDHRILSAALAAASAAIVIWWW